MTLTPSGPTSQATITLTVTGTTGRTTTLSYTYVASVPTTPTSRVLLGSSDASTAMAVGDGYLMVADDEDPMIRLYDPTVSGREVGQFTTGEWRGEIDFESSARRGDAIFWLGSHDNKKDGEQDPSRHVVFRTQLSGSGANAKIAPVGVPYRGLRSDLARLGPAPRRPVRLQHAEDSTLFDIEGAEFSPDDSALYLGFRYPTRRTA